jgi:DNA-binding phage protein
MDGMKISYRVDAPSDLSERIRSAVEASDKLTVQICADACISQTTLYSLISGDAPSVKVQTLQSLAKSLGVKDCFGVKY